MMQMWICGRCLALAQAEQSFVCATCGGTDVVPVSSPRGQQLCAALSPGPQPQQYVAPPHAAAPLQPSSAPPQDRFGIILTLLPFVGAALCWLWVANSPLFTASSNLGVVSAIVILGTALFGALDAASLQLGSPNGPAPRETGPIGTFLAVVLLWLFVYPYYMFRRARFGMKRMGAIALLGAVLFAASSLVMYMAIEGRMGEIRMMLDR